VEEGVAMVRSADTMEGGECDVGDVLSETAVAGALVGATGGSLGFGGHC
jgi:hypothetical protein